jgi:hypothetical protein
MGGINQTSISGVGTVDEAGETGVGIGGTEDDGLGTGLTKAVFGTVVVGGGGKSGINLDGAGVDATGVARIVSGLVAEVA